MKQILEGSNAIAKIINLIKPAVVSAYPITPQTHIVEDLAKLKADGKANYEYVRAESEFAAASIVLGSSAAGSRVYTATSSQGLLLMTEVVFNIAGMRLPVVMTCANRGVSAPITIWCFTKEAEVLMGDLTYKPIHKVKKGDLVLGKDKKGNLRFTKVKRLYERYSNDLVELKTDKFSLTCTSDHKFYQRTGHDHWTKAKKLKGKNLHWFGYNYSINDQFKKGWLAGVSDGDGCFYAQDTRFHFRLKAKDEEMIDTFIKWSNYFDYPVKKVKYLEKEGYFIAILTLNKEAKKFKKFLDKHNENKDFARGYISGMYDAEGTGPHKDKTAVIYNNDTIIIKRISKYLKSLNLKFKIYTDNRRGGYYKNDNYHIKIKNVPEFFIKCRPVITRKRENLLKMTLKSVKSRLEILDVKQINKKRKVYNIETETNNYIVNGFLVHNCDHQDAMTVRDAGWIMLFAENLQEAVDLHLVAYKVAERINVPVMVNVDGFVLTHTYEPVEIPSQKEVNKFLPKYTPKKGTYLDTKNPRSFGAFATPPDYLEIRQELHEAVKGSKKLIQKEIKTWNRVFKKEREKIKKGKKLIDNGLIEYYGSPNPEVVFIAMGSMAGTVKHYLDNNSHFGKGGTRGISAGVLKIRSFRPLPKEDILSVLKKVKYVAVLDKSISLGKEGILAEEIKALFHNSPFNKGGSPARSASAATDAGGRGIFSKVQSFVVGLGGRDITDKTFERIISEIKDKDDSEKFIG